MTNSLSDLNRDDRRQGKQLFELAAKLYPLCRSLTGNGVRETLSHINTIIPLSISEVPSGTPVFDWTVPDEWNIRDAYIKNDAGDRVVDFQQCNLHVLSYSIPVNRVMSLEQLRPHLFTLPDKPDWIPYRTSYYNRHWGFCLSQNQLDQLSDGDYQVCIDSSLEPGNLTYGETVIPGEVSEEVLLSCHICHPSLANDNLSGIAVATYAAKHLLSRANYYTYRILFIPATIGSLAWLASNQSAAANIRHGLVLACLGDTGSLSYKRSRQGDNIIDRAAAHILQRQPGHQLFDFSPFGYDERQYCSPGFNLPVGRLSRTPHGMFPEYHTSADNMDFLQPEQLTDSLRACLDILNLLEKNRTYLNQKPMGEPKLSKYGLYDTIGGSADIPAMQNALLWLLNLSDGENDLLDICDQSGLPFEDIASAAAALHQQGLLEYA